MMHYQLKLHVHWLPINVFHVYGEASNPMHCLSDHETKAMGLWFMVFNANFNNISVISWRSDLLVEETGVPGENHRPVASH